MNGARYIGIMEKLEIVQIVMVSIFAVTLIVAIIGTVFSIKAAKAAIETASKESRPWVFPVKINTYLHRDMMTIKVEITNGGKIPAFMKLTPCMKVGSETKKPEETETSLSIIMPNQVVKTSFVVKNASYQAVIKGEKDLAIDLAIEYSDRKEKIDKYFSHTIWGFEPTFIPTSWDRVSPIEMVAIWRISSADMK
ncbi:MAG TPA: hypothetical protein G4O17_01470 [Dehalococcoidia bacterium]|nr:hypothetical protein [Dehalococcoidia bacterium]